MKPRRRGLREPEYFGMDLGGEPSRTVIRTVDYAELEMRAAALKAAPPYIKTRPTVEPLHMHGELPSRGDMGYLERTDVRRSIIPPIRYEDLYETDTPFEVPRTVRVPSTDTGGLTSSEIFSILNDVANGRPDRLNILRQTASSTYEAIADSWRRSEEFRVRQEQVDAAILNTPMDAAIRNMPRITVSAAEAAESLQYFTLQMPEPEPEAEVTVKVLKRRIVIRKREDV